MDVSLASGAPSFFLCFSRRSMTTTTGGHTLLGCVMMCQRVNVKPRRRKEAEVMRAIGRQEVRRAGGIERGCLF